MADYTASIVEAASASDHNEGSTFFAGVVESCAASDKITWFFDDPLTPATFRLQFPPFANTAMYPDRQVQFYIGMATKLLRSDRWGDMIKEGYALFTAHFLALDRLAATQPGGASGVPGTAVGVINSGSVDKVSFGKDVQSVMEDDAGHWGMTTYGSQYLRFARMFGAGPIQVGAGGDPHYPGQSASLYNGAWPGPMFPYSGW